MLSQSLNVTQVTASVSPVNKLNEDAASRRQYLEMLEALTQPRARVLAIQPTDHMISSLCWNVALAQRARGAGLTLVITPTLAAIRHQVESATKAGLRARFIDHSNKDEWPSTIQAIALKQVDVLMVTPKRFSNPTFSEILPELLRDCSLVVIYDAHRISEYDSEYDTEFDFVLSCLRDAPTAAILAMTSGATPQAMSDVCAQLDPNTRVFQAGSVSSLPRLSCISGLDHIQRFAWIDQALWQLPGFGMIFCHNWREAQSLADFLVESRHNVTAYHGGTPKAEQRAIEQAIRDDKFKAVVATSAFAPENFPPKTSFCIHVGVQPALDSYHRQLHLGGRWTDGAQAILLSAEDDCSCSSSSISEPQQDVIEKIRILATVKANRITAGELEAITGINQIQLFLHLKALGAVGAIEYDGKILSVPTQRMANHILRQLLVTATWNAAADATKRYVLGLNCLRALLHEVVGISKAQACGNCSACTGEVPYPGLQTSQEADNKALGFLSGRKS